MTKDDLYRPRKVAQEISAKTKHLQSLLCELAKKQEKLSIMRLKASSPPGINLSGMPGSHNSYENKFEKRMADIIDFEASIKEMQAEISKASVEIIHLEIKLIYETKELYIELGKIPDRYIQRVFLLRYIDNMCWEDIAEDMSDDIRFKTDEAVKKICYRYLNKLDTDIQSEVEENENRN